MLRPSRASSIQSDRCRSHRALLRTAARHTSATAVRSPYGEARKALIGRVRSRIVTWPGLDSPYRI